MRKEVLRIFTRMKPCMLLILLIISLAGVAQPGAKKEPLRVLRKETLPEPPGGLGAFYKFINSAYKKPAGFSGSGIIYLQFTVKRNGYLAKATVTKGIEGCPACDAEALRVINTSPRWTPGTVNGKPVDVSYTLPVSVD